MHKSKQIYWNLADYLQESETHFFHGDSCLDCSNRSEIWQAPRQQRYRDACQIPERYDHYNIQSRGFETPRDLAVRRLTAYWIYAPEVVPACALFPMFNSGAEARN